MNSFGRILRLTTFGESHGVALGGVLDGCPAGLKLDFNEIEQILQYRRPGSSDLVSSRNEEDKVEWLSGLLSDGTTMGTPIGFIIHNKDAHSKDYQGMEHLFRPSHADYTYYHKYHIPPQPGGGRSSARETVIRCVGGAIALQLLRTIGGIEILPYICSVGEESLRPEERATMDIRTTFSFPSRCPHPEADRRIATYLERVRQQKDSVGGVIECVVRGIPIGFGSPLYDKLSARLAYAMLSINAAKGFEIGDGFSIASHRGSEVNDTMYCDAMGQTHFTSNHNGGIQGGISNGEELFFSVAFKPTPTIGVPQNSVTITGEPNILEAKGRHDPCVALRAVAVVQAMTALVLADEYMITRATAPLP